MICINWTKAHSSFIHDCADLWTYIVRCSSCVAGCAYYLYYCILGIFLKLDVFMCALKNIVLFWMRSSCWCCSSGCGKCIIFFCPGSFSPWFGRTEMRTSVFSCILRRWEFHYQAWTLSCPGACFQASSSQITCFLILWGLSLCKNLNSVVYECCGI